MRFIILLFTMLLTVGACADGIGGEYASECHKSDTPLAVAYCTHKPKAGGSTNIIYYLHGSGGSELQWADEWYFTRQLRDQWIQTGAALPTVVSVSFGPVWLLAEPNTSRFSGLLDYFTKVLIPQVETQLGGLTGERYVLGASMGGFNSVQLALKTDLFNKAAILCAPMATISPFAQSFEVERFIRASAAWQYFEGVDEDAVRHAVQEMIQISTSFYPTKEEWLKADPLVLAGQADPLTAPEIYLAAGFYDPYALFEGNEIFAAKLIERGLKVDWRPQWGGHCAIDIPTLAEFLSPAP